MATDNSDTNDSTNEEASASHPQQVGLGDIVVMVLKPLASLKLTVVLFALSIFLVLAGTLAQVELDIWDVIDGYFRTPVAWIEFQVFFPPSFFPNLPDGFGNGLYFPFPGGWLIGGLMGVNLLAAHALRFKVQATDSRLIAGLVVLGIGVAVTWLVIASGSNNDGLQQEAWIEWSTLWTLLKVGMGAVWLAMANALLKIDSGRKLERAFMISVVVGIGALLVWLFYEGDAAQLGDSSMRILWQLIKGTVSGLVLLAGCIMLFKKRAGIVLLHGGIGLMMFNELFVGLTAVEGQMPINEGETINYVQDIRQVELAIIDESDPKEDIVVAVPQSVMETSAEEKSTVSDAFLPFDVEVLRFHKNSNLREIESADQNPATTGAGLVRFAEEAKAGVGTDTGGAVDMASAYVRLHKKGSADEIETMLVSQFLNPQPITVDGTTYQVSLRFKRNYKSYSLHLVDVRKDDYLGTDTPRNFSSEVRLVDPTANVDREIRIWMNNPLRFAGETFYQSSYGRDPATGGEYTVLQVVTNTGWMIPYVSCMIVATGMLAQFWITLLRFLNRRAGNTNIVQGEASSETDGRTKKSKRKQREEQIEQSNSAGWLLPTFIVVICAAWIGSKARIPQVDDAEMKIHEFGKLPLVYEGRIKPFDTLARNTLRIISDKEEFVENEDDDDKQPAIRWLLDVISGSDAAEKHKVFRIENLDVLETLGLTRRKGFRYSVEELRPKADEFNADVEQARTKAKEFGPESLSVYERKAIELDGQIRRYTLLLAAFQPPPLPPVPTEEEFQKDREAATRQMQLLRQAVIEMPRQLATMQPPLGVPIMSEEDDNAGGLFENADEQDWQPYSTAWTQAYLKTRYLGGEPDPATIALNAILVAYANGEATEFNDAVDDYKKLLASDPPEKLDTPKVDFEAFFNHFAPFYHASVLYVFAFILAALAWLGWNRPLNNAAFWLILFTLLVHTFALIARIYISGRPPVTNLYSSAVFIGWGAVVLGLILEVIYRLGIGNIIASVAGFATLLIAHFLAGDGDTFVVLQAVLDTQFWLATHVVCITLGYSTTFVAGLLGVVYILMGVCTPKLTSQTAKDLSRMIYGTICFAIFFSFVGTVLGGLWADDSWGRFWGWDPKENGALIIVLWNALVLHARWDGMIKDRGLAALAVAGNIATSWSWFGVNELGVGLHSYGFTEGVLLTLGVFVVTQLAIIVMGSLPKEMWWSHQPSNAGDSA